ncbi:hypothetical protein OSTOST_19515, partial [Ostertagia ostertagi]
MNKQLITLLCVTSTAFSWQPLPFRCWSVSTLMRPIAFVEYAKCARKCTIWLSHNIINNFLLLHCSSIVSSSICLVGADLLQNILHSLTLAEICQLEHMCSASASGFPQKHLNLSRLHSYDVDAINVGVLLI